MNTILNELEWAEQALSTCSLGNRPYEMIFLIAKYYYYMGYDAAGVRDRLDDFVIQCDPRASLPKWSAALDAATKSAKKYPIVIIDSITVTEPELLKINSVQGIQARRLAFSLLCLAKYLDIVRPNNNHWVSTPDREIMQMANISTSIKKQSSLFSALKDAGLISFAKRVDNLNVQVRFIEDGVEAVSVRDFRNLGFQYMKLCGGDYFECENCGITVKRPERSAGRSPKYCPSCAFEIKMRQSVRSVRRCRSAIPCS